MVTHLECPRGQNTESGLESSCKSSARIFWKRSRQSIATPKNKHQDVNNRGNREYWRREKALDEALKDTFPASDPVSVEQPGLPATAGIRIHPQERALPPVSSDF